jgi:hypothetical protein
VATVHDDYHRVKPGIPYSSVAFHVYASEDKPWVAQTLSQCTPVKYGWVSSNSTTVEATQFAGTQEILHGPVHNSNLLTRARWSVFNQLKKGLPHWSSECMIHTTINLSIQCSPLSSNCPTRSLIMTTFSMILLNPHRTSIDRKVPIVSRFQPLIFYR